MWIFTLVPALLLCSLSWISVSSSESQTVEVKPGEEVTLRCSNISEVITHTFWSRLDNVNRGQISCISSMYGSTGDAEFCHGFQNGKFDMSSNISFVFLKIKQVDLSDSGLYLCGFHMNTRTMIDVIHVKVEDDKEPYCDIDGKCKECCSNLITKLTCLMMGALTAMLVMIIIGLLVKILMLQTAHREESTHQEQNPGSDDVIYSEVIFHPKANYSSASERQLETHVDSGNKQ